MKNLIEAWRAFWSDLKYAVLILAFLVLALCLFLISYKIDQSYPNLAKATEKLGGLAITVVVFQLIVRFWVTRSSEAAFFEKLKVRDSVVQSGFREFFWFDQVPWESLFREASEVEIFAITARLLTGDRISITRSFLRRANAKLIVVIHDPGDSEAMERFDRKLNEKAGTRREKTLQHIQDLMRLARENGVAGRLEIRFSRAAPSYTYYRFDDKVLFVPYLIKPSIRIPEHIPAFLFASGEVMEKFLKTDSTYIREESKDVSDEVTRNETAA